MHRVQEIRADRHQAEEKGLCIAAIDWRREPANTEAAISEGGGVGEWGRKGA